MPDFGLAAFGKENEVPSAAGRVLADAEPLTLAASSTRSMRPRTLDAVSGLLSQIGWSTGSTVSVETSAVGTLNIGPAWVVSELRHCCRCFWLRIHLQYWRRAGSRTRRMSLAPAAVRSTSPSRAIAPFQEKYACCCCCLLAGFGERNVQCRSQTQFDALAVEGADQKPWPARWPHAQISPPP